MSPSELCGDSRRCFRIPLKSSLRILYDSNYENKCISCVVVTAVEVVIVVPHP